ncbi:MAG TPA: hypothetical protein VFO79_13890 [Xanthomonadales bacterium]|nr:hypothetical protein [Xanthomonadales bacterium]
MGRAQVICALLLVACGEPKPAVAPDLADYLYKLSGRDEATRVAAVTSWTLSRAEWERVVVDSYRPLYDDYVAASTQARETFVAQLAKSRSIVSRAHFAGDPVATHAQAITRWALPTLAPTRVAELGGRPPVPIDAVFVDVDGTWRAIVGMDAIVRRRIAAIDPACAIALDHIEPAGGPCIEAAWAVADAALREDRARFAHGCGLATNLCGKRSP